MPQLADFEQARAWLAQHSQVRYVDLLLPDQKDSLGEFLKRCDLVKFAKYEPGPPELQDLHASAMRLVEETEPIMTTLSAVKSGRPA